jgi:uncharacterized MAPEG superfamily protein
MNSRSKLLLWSVLIRFILVLAVATIARAEARHQDTHKIFTVKGDVNEIISWSIN